MTDAFRRIEADVVAVGEFLEQARRYRPLVGRADAAYRRATAIAARVRAANRGGEGVADLETLADEIRDVARAAKSDLDGFLAGPQYRGLLDSIAQEGDDAAARIHDLFADIEPLDTRGDLYLPLVRPARPSAAHEKPAKGSALEESPGTFEPQAAAEIVARMARDGIEPQAGPGVGADAAVRPIRFFEGVEGIDAPILLTVPPSAGFTAPAFRAPELGEVLVYAHRLRVSFAVGLRLKSPDDWLELRAGGYTEYRRRCRDLFTAAGTAVVDL